MRTLATLALLLGLTSSAFADQADPNFPTLSLTPATEATPAPSPAPGAKEAALKQIVDQARTSVEANVTPPPAEMTLTSGVNQIIPISRNNLNRFITSFKKPEVKTASQQATAFFDDTGKVLYAGTPTTEPFAIFIFDSDHPEQAFSLTLVPRDIPPVQVTLNLAGRSSNSAIADIAPIPDQALEWETNTDYSDTIVSVLRALAKREVPQGYGLTTNIGSDGFAPICQLKGTKVSVRQRLTGGALVVYVARVDNTSGMPLVLDDPSCPGSTLLASALWPNRELAAGAATELYLVLRRPMGPNPRAVRPSVLAGS